MEPKEAPYHRERVSDCPQSGEAVKGVWTVACLQHITAAIQKAARMLLNWQGLPSEFPVWPHYSHLITLVIGSSVFLWGGIPRDNQQALCHCHCIDTCPCCTWPEEQTKTPIALLTPPACGSYSNVEEDSFSSLWALGSPPLHQAVPPAWAHSTVLYSNPGWTFPLAVALSLWSGNPTGNLQPLCLDHFHGTCPSCPWAGE